MIKTPVRLAIAAASGMSLLWGLSVLPAAAMLESPTADPAAVAAVQDSTPTAEDTQRDAVADDLDPGDLGDPTDPNTDTPGDPDLTGGVRWHCWFDRDGSILRDGSGADNLCRYISWSPGVGNAPVIDAANWPEPGEISCRWNEYEPDGMGNPRLHTNCNFTPSAGPSPTPTPSVTPSDGPSPTLPDGPSPTLPDGPSPTPSPSTAPEQSTSPSSGQPVPPPPSQAGPSTAAPSTQGPAVPAPPTQSGAAEAPRALGNEGTLVPPVTADPVEDAESAPEESSSAGPESEGLVTVQVTPQDAGTAVDFGIGAPASTVDIAVSMAIAAGGIVVLGGLWFGFRGLLGRL